MSLNKIVLTGSLVPWLLCVSCSSCSKDVPHPPIPVPTTTVSIVVPPLPTTKVVSSLKASVVIPIVFEDQQASTIDAPNYKLFANSLNKELISLDAEAFSSSYEEYVLEAIRFLKERGVIVHSANKVIVNNVEMTMVESSSKGVVAWFWITTKDGVGYTFTCGGLETSSTVQAMCDELSNSFKIQ